MSSPIRRVLPRRDDASGSLEPPFDPNSWSGALIMMSLVAGLLWIVELVNVANDYSFMPPPNSSATTPEQRA